MLKHLCWACGDLQQMLREIKTRSIWNETSNIMYLCSLLGQVEGDPLADFGRQLREHLGLKTTDHDLAQPPVQLVQVGRSARVPLPARPKVPARDWARGKADARFKRRETSRENTYLQRCPEGIVKHILTLPPGSRPAPRQPSTVHRWAARGPVCSFRALCRAGNYFV